MVFITLQVLLSAFMLGVFSKSFRYWVLYDIGLKTKYASQPNVTTGAYTSVIQSPQSHYTPSNESSLEQTLAFEHAESIWQYPLACKPETFGYSMRESQDKFPSGGYPRCSERYQPSYSKFEVRPQENVFELHCKGNLTGEYLLGSSGPFSFPEINEARPFLHPLEYPGRPVKFNSSVDYVLARCGAEQGFPIAAHFPRLNRRRQQEALSQRRGAKPLIVMLMVLDSFSRRHFYQKLPLTVKLFEELNAGKDFAVVDFKLHNVIGDGSADNTIPIFKGNCYLDGELDSSGAHRFTNKIGKDAIWEDFKQRGFMTLLAFEGCDLKFPDVIGRLTNPDHLVRHFYCALTSLGTMTTDKKGGSEQRCIGPHMAHVYGFNYMRNFTSMYAGANQWIYAHYEAGHEASGRHAETIDLDLRDFLQDYLRDFGRENEIVIMTLADHGMRFGDWFKDIRGYQEHKLPAFFFLASRSYLDSLPGAYATLLHNSHELMSKKDIRRTLLYLSQYPDPQAQVPPDSYAVAYNLLTELIPDNRTCSEAGIPVWYCSCLSFQEIDLACSPELTQMLHRLIDISIHTINSQVYVSHGLSKGFGCEKVEGGELRSAYGVQASSHQEIVKVVFGVKNRASAIFAATFTLGPYPFGVGKKWEMSMWKYQLPIPVLYRSVKSYLNLILLSRIDKFEGPCEVASVKLGLKADFCFCK